MEMQREKQKVGELVHPEFMSFIEQSGQWESENSWTLMGQERIDTHTYTYIVN